MAAHSLLSTHWGEISVHSDYGSALQTTCTCSRRLALLYFFLRGESLAVLSPTQAGQAGLQAYQIGYSTVSRLSTLLLGIIVRQQQRRHLKTDRLPFLRYSIYCHRREAVPASPSQQLSKCCCSLRTCLRSTSLTSTCPDIPPEFDLLRRGTTSGLLDERMLTPTGSLGSANFCNPIMHFL